MTERVSIFFGFIVAIIVPSILMALPYFFLNGISRGFQMAFVGSGFTLLPIIFVGMPVVYVLKKYNMITWWACVLTGVLAGVLMAFFLKPHVDVLIKFSWVGALSAFCFWLVWRLGIKKNQEEKMGSE